MARVAPSSSPSPQSISSLFAGFQIKKKNREQAQAAEKAVVADQAGPSLLDTMQKQGLLKLPPRAGWTDYTGRFWSSKYTKALSRGNVYVQLPDAVDPAVPVEVEAQIQYKGLYRLNKVERFPIVMRDQNAAEVKEFTTPPTQVQGHDAPHGKGVLTFQVEQRQGQKLRGKYTLTHPKDEGHFELDPGMTHGENCVLM